MDNQENNSQETKKNEEQPKKRVKKNRTIPTYNSEEAIKAVLAAAYASDIASAEIDQPKKKKYAWVGTLVLFAVIALGIFLMFRIVYSMGKDIKSFDEVLAASDVKFALISLAILITIFICMWLQYAVILKATTKKWHLVPSLKVAFLGKFYDNITPFASGGQPMQIYYLNKKGFRGGISSAVIMIKYFAWMFCWLVLSSVIMSSCIHALDGQEYSSRLYMLIMGWIGLFANMFVPILIVLFVTLPKFSRLLVGGIITIGHKLHIVKNTTKTLYKVEKIVHDFRASFAIMSKRPMYFIGILILCTLEVFLTFSFPYFIMKMFAGLAPTDGISVLFSVLALNIYATMSVSIIPTPGNSGAIEGVVTAAFAMAAGSVLLWTVFVWRFVVYYVYIIIGIIMTLCDFIRRVIKNRKDKKNNSGESKCENQE